MLLRYVLVSFECSSCACRNACYQMRGICEQSGDGVCDGVGGDVRWRRVTLRRAIAVFALPLPVNVDVVEVSHESRRIVHVAIVAILSL